jgi:hypothetical protein
MSLRNASTSMFFGLLTAGAKVLGATLPLNVHEENWIVCKCDVNMSVSCAHGADRLEGFIQVRNHASSARSGTILSWRRQSIEQ